MARRQIACRRFSSGPDGERLGERYELLRRVLIELEQTRSRRCGSLLEEDADDEGLLQESVIAREPVGVALEPLLGVLAGVDGVGEHVRQLLPYPDWQTLAENLGDVGENGLLEDSQEDGALRLEEGGGGRACSGHEVLRDVVMREEVSFGACSSR